MLFFAHTQEFFEKEKHERLEQRADFARRIAQLHDIGKEKEGPKRVFAPHDADDCVKRWVDDK